MKKSSKRIPKFTTHHNIFEEPDLEKLTYRQRVIRMKYETTLDKKSFFAYLNNGLKITPLSELNSCEEVLEKKQRKGRKKKNQTTISNTVTIDEEANANLNNENGFKPESVEKEQVVNETESECLIIEMDTCSFIEESEWDRSADAIYIAGDTKENKGMNRIKEMIVSLHK